MMDYIENLFSSVYGNGRNRFIFCLDWWWNYSNPTTNMLQFSTAVLDDKVDCSYFTDAPSIICQQWDTMTLHHKCTLPWTSEIGSFNSNFTCLDIATYWQWLNPKANLHCDRWNALIIEEKFWELTSCSKSNVMVPLVFSSTACAGNFLDTLLITALICFLTLLCPLGFSKANFRKCIRSSIRNWVKGSVYCNTDVYNSRASKQCEVTVFFRL